jgi:hypothetical protein
MNMQLTLSPLGRTGAVNAVRICGREICKNLQNFWYLFRRGAELEGKAR